MFVFDNTFARLFSLNEENYFFYSLLYIYINKMYMHFYLSVNNFIKGIIIFLK